MDKQEYLNEISASARPAPKSMPGILSSRFFWVGAIGAILLIIIIIIGAILSGSKTGTKDHIFSLITHIDNTSAVISEYQPSVKSSDLRSYSTSLYSILSDTNKSLTNYATEKYNYKPSSVKDSIVEEETSAKDALSSELFAAKINGFLDSTYAQKVAYEISLIMSREAQIMKSISSSDLQDRLDSSYNSLDNLYSKFNDFSESQ